MKDKTLVIVIAVIIAVMIVYHCYSSKESFEKLGGCRSNINKGFARCPNGEHWRKMAGECKCTHIFQFVEKCGFHVLRMIADIDSCVFVLFLVVETKTP